MPNVIITPIGSWLSFTPKSCVPSSWESETGHRTIIATLTMLLAIKFFFQAITVFFFLGGGQFFPPFLGFFGVGVGCRKWGVDLSFCSSLCPDIDL